MESVAPQRHGFDAHHLNADVEDMQERHWSERRQRGSEQLHDEVLAARVVRRSVHANDFGKAEHGRIDVPNRAIHSKFTPDHVVGNTLLAFLQYPSEKSTMP